MKATVDKKILSEALSLMLRVVERRTTIPIITNVLLKAAPDGAGLMLRVTNLDIEMETTIKAELADTGSTTVPAAMLHDIVARMKDGAPVIIEDVAKGRAIVRAGRSRFTLPTLPESDWPELTRRDFAADFTLPGEQLAALLGRPAFAVGHEQTRPYLGGVFLHVRKGHLRAVATDGHRMARLDTPLPAGADGMPGVIVPEKTVKEMAKLCETAKSGPVRLQVSSNVIRLEAGATSMISKLIDGTFPDYERVIPTGNNKTMVVAAREMADAVARMMAVVATRGHALRLSIDENGVKLDLARVAEGIEAVEEVEADYDSAPMQIGFQSGYLADILGSLSGKTVQVKLADPGSPTLFSDPADAAWLTLLMPCRM